ncbi:MAG TPA: hypothetical protein VHA12_00965 [Candidatus Nanoarchaeia archaeon]|nr:hypothetical protein [Candidatus Nanoarchaeia archaeon]
MNFKFSKYKVITSLFVLILTRLWIYYMGEDSNLLVALAPAIFIYILWSLFENK